MASHTLAIARASFAASLMRPDPTPVPRNEVAEFHSHFDALLKQCSSSNIQLCKEWLLRHIAPSKTRTVALGKYFSATCRSLVKTVDDGGARIQQAHEPPVRRRQLHVLYLLSDLLHHVEFHADSSSTKVTLVEGLSSSLSEIFQLTSGHSVESFPKHYAKIQGLLELWAKQGFYHSTYIQELRDTVANAAQDGNKAEDGARPLNEMQNDSSAQKRDAPYIMPPSHGDPSIPFYDLPAGNMLPLIIPNSTAPINPQSMKPLEFVAGPADPQLAAAVEDFLTRVDALDMAGGFKSEDGKYDVDELGQPLLRDLITGEILEGEGYYGWSRGFCEKMKSGGDIRGFGNDMLRDHSRSRSRSPRKRRRYSSSQSYSSVERGRSFSRSRSRSLERQRFRNVSVSRSPSPPSDPRLRGPRPPQTHPTPPQAVQTQGPSPPPPPPFTQGFPLGPGGVPIPPRPAGYSGPWPPPPPPPPSGPGGVLVPPKPAGYSGPWPPPPPPPPPLGPSNASPYTPGYQGGSNQPFIGRQPSASNPGQSYPCNMPPQTQPHPSLHNTSYHNNSSPGYGRGGWTR